MKSHSSDMRGEHLMKIIDFVETTIVVKKDKEGLGLDVVGGIDTYLQMYEIFISRLSDCDVISITIQVLQGGVVISDVTQGGAVERDGRVKVGDQILGVNGESLRYATHKEAVNALRLATSPVRVVILREDPEKIYTTTEEPTSVRKVVLKKSIADHLGLSILARKDRKGVFVTNVAEKSLADLDGTIQQGDRILEVNGEDLQNATQEQATQVIRRAYGTIKLKVGRIKSLNASLQLDTSVFSFTNLGLDDEKGGNFRRYNSFGYDWIKKRRKASTDKNRNVETARPRSRSIQREYSTTSMTDGVMNRGNVEGRSPKYTALIPAASSDSQSTDSGQGTTVQREAVELSFNKSNNSSQNVLLHGNYRKEDYV